MRVANALFPPLLLGLAWLIGNNPGTDGVGSSLLALLCYIAGIVSLLVGASSHFREWRQRRASWKWLWLFVVYAGLYATPLCGLVWNVFYRERVDLSYLVEWRTPKEWSPSDFRYEIISGLGSMSDNLASKSSPGGALTSQMGGRGLRHVICLFRRSEDRDSAFVFHIHFPKTIREGEQSNWISPVHRGYSKTDYEFLIGKNRGEVSITDTNGIQLRYIITHVERRRGP